MAFCSAAASDARHVFSNGKMRHMSRRVPLQTRCCLSQTKVNVRDILDDCSNLGKVRFIVIGDGAILESVNTFSSVRYNPVPSRGTFATIAVQDKSFECHINLSKVREVKFVRAKAKTGDYETYATRFLGDNSKLVLSCLLHGLGGDYDPKAVEAWLALQQKYGDGVVVEDAAE